jgi:hypothetical protein
VCVSTAACAASACQNKACHSLFPHRRRVAEMQQNGEGGNGRHGDLCSLLLVFLLRPGGDCPDESEQFPAHRGDRLVLVLTPCRQLRVARMESPLRLPRKVLHLLLQALLSFAQKTADPGSAVERASASASARVLKHPLQAEACSA